MGLKPAVSAWSLGYAVFLASSGSAVVGQSEQAPQLVVGGVLLAAVAPLVYRVLDADEVGNLEEKSRRPLPYLVAATLSSVLIAAVVPVPGGDWLAATTVRGGVFLAVIGLVSYLAINLVRTEAGGWTLE